MGLPANRALYMNEEMVDIICGKFFICGAPANSGEFVSLSNEQAEIYRKMFERPERFFKIGDTIAAVKYTPDREER